MSLLFAQSEAGAAAQTAPQSPLVGFLPLIIIFLIFYFLLILPQQRKQKKQQEMIANIKSGDEVVTLGGLHGKIVDVKAESFVLEIAPNTKVRIARHAVSQKTSS